MKSIVLSAVLSIAALSSCASAAIKVGIHKGSHPQNRKRDLQIRQNILEVLGNNFTGQSYMATVTVGTPPQDIALAIDTGSSDTWLLGTETDLCVDLVKQEDEGTGCQTPFNADDSSTFKIRNKNAFHITYGDQSGVDGDYITDDFTIGDASISNLVMGFAHTANLTQGLFGIGYALNEASNYDDPSTTANDAFVYPNVIDAMVLQKLININAYSLYLDDLDSDSGSIIFGGLDKDKFHGNLVQMPVVPRTLRNGTDVYAEFAVALTSFSVGGSDLSPSTPPPVILDSGTALTYLPETLATDIYTKLNAYDDSQSYFGTGLVFADCDLISNEPDTTLDFGFGGTGGSDSVTIKVPLSEMILFPEKLGFSLDGFIPNDITFSNVCILGIMSQPDEPYILGDTFLRSAYVVYDLKNNVIALAQTNFDSTDSDVLDFEADQTSIPAVSGVASSAGISETASGPVGDGTKTATKSATSGRATATATETSGSGSGSGSGSSPTRTITPATVTVTPDKKAGAIPAFEARGLFVLGGSAVLTVLGAGWFLA